MFYLCSYNPCNAPLQLCALKSTISGLVPTYYIPMQHVRATPAYVRLKLTDTPATEPPWTTWRIVFGEGAAHYWAHKQSDSTLLWSPSPQKLMHTTDQSSAVKKCSCPKSSAQISCVVPQELEPGGLPWPASADEDQNLFTHTFSWSAICNLTSSDTTWWGAATACKRSWGPTLVCPCAFMVCNLQYLIWLPLTPRYGGLPRPASAAEDETRLPTRFHDLK